MPRVAARIEMSTALFLVGQIEIPALRRPLEYYRGICGNETQVGSANRIRRPRPGLRVGPGPSGCRGSKSVRRSGRCTAMPISCPPSGRGAQNESHQCDAGSRITGRLTLGPGCRSERPAIIVKPVIHAEEQRWSPGSNPARPCSEAGLPYPVQGRERCSSCLLPQSASPR